MNVRVDGTTMVRINDSLVFKVPAAFLSALAVCSSGSEKRGVKERLKSHFILSYFQFCLFTQNHKVKVVQNQLLNVQTSAVDFPQTGKLLTFLQSRDRRD